MPEQVESMLGDAVSNVAFDLYTGLLKYMFFADLVGYLRWDSLSESLKAQIKLLGGGIDLKNYRVQ